MTPNRLKIFENENPGGSLEFLTLSSKDSLEVSDAICKLAGAQTGLEPKEYFGILLEILPETFSFEIDSIDSGAFLDMVLADLDPSSKTKVQVIWYNGEMVDAFEYRVLRKHWEYIWYNSYDYALILHIPESNQLVFVSHWGVVKALKPSTP